MCGGATGGGFQEPVNDSLEVYLQGDSPRALREGFDGNGPSNCSSAFYFSRFEKDELTFLSRKGRI